jgi:hypothetical protein
MGAGKQGLDNRPFGTNRKVALIGNHRQFHEGSFYGPKFSLSQQRKRPIRAGISDFYRTGICTINFLAKGVQFDPSQNHAGFRALPDRRPYAKNKAP